MKYTETMRECDLKAIGMLAHEVGGHNIGMTLIDGWGKKTAEVPSIVFARRYDITLAETIEAILDHFEIEVVRGPICVMARKKAKEQR